ncbi:MAG TPA: T9SS type A sorting domain-containing protein, partial [Chryseobacterium sp.]
LLSSDGGLTFPTVLVASTPNNGSYSYTVPGGLGNIANARIMVKGVNNIFLNVNLQNFTINSSVVVTPPVVVPPVRVFQGLMIYPVPSNDGYVYIKADFPSKLDDKGEPSPYKVTYEVYAMDGKLVVPQKTRHIFREHLEQINLKHVPTETYMIHVTVDGEKIVKKLLMLHK